jgi:hypothetical protein
MSVFLWAMGLTMCDYIVLYMKDDKMFAPPLGLQFHDWIIHANHY